jgi:aminoglycoside phosphotransferase
VIGARSQTDFVPLSLDRGLLSELNLARVRALVVNTSKDPNAKVTILLFPPGSVQPILAIKLPTTDAAQLAVEKERRMLADLQRLDLGCLRSSVPRVVRVLELRGRRALLTSAMAGSPQLTRYHRWRHTATPETVRADFDAVGAWLAALQERTASSVRPVDLGHELPRMLRSRFDGHPAIEETVRLLQEVLAALSATHTPLTVVHGDFWIGNLLTKGGAVSGVVDWEGGAVAGEPVRDLVRFALAYALYLDRHARAGDEVVGHPGLVAGTWGAGVIYAIRGEGWFPDLFRGFLQDGLARLGAAPELWREAALAGLAEIAATTDDPGFALGHLELLRCLVGSRA